MKTLLRTSACLLALVVNSCTVPENRAPTSQSRLTPRPGDLPALIIGTAAEARFSMQPDGAAPGQSGFESLLAAVDYGWWRRHRIRDYALDLKFLIQNEYPGQRYGLPREKWLGEESMWRNRMFVTEPIPSFRDRCLVVVSEYSPCQTWIFAVGTDLVLTTVFDNDSHTDTQPVAVATRVASDNASNSELFISTVEEIVPLGPGKYLLVDYDMRFGISREIELTAKDNNVSLVQVRTRAAPPPDDRTR